jgi:precorrin-2 dehydrogenase/sirohydrochlorin ferrochelatase
MTAREGVRRGYPAVLRLEGRRVLVVGGGKVAARRAAGLLEAGARVVAVSPAFSPGFPRARGSGRVTRVRRAYRTGDLAGARLVVVATDDARVNARVAAEARRAGVWANVAADPARGDFIVPAVVRRNGLLLALSSGGASPALVGHLRRALDRLVPEDAGALVAALGKARDEVRRRVADPAQRREILTRLFTRDGPATLRTERSGAVLRRIEAPTAAGGRRRARPGGRPASARTPRRRARAARPRRAARTRA